MADVTAPEISSSPRLKALTEQYANLARTFQNLEKKRWTGLTPDEKLELEFLEGMSSHGLFDPSLKEGQLREKIETYNKKLTEEASGSIGPKDIEEYSQLGIIQAIDGLGDPADRRRLEELTRLIKGRKA